ncbi:hypothetical protein CISIN_1g005301mg [Citrus sinensis]|uniref:BHLH domain-containing protein n=2 Tax=Citrus sinensis TaxID=2711 RepID=A0A067DZ97_CITSI|nr:hypothetical protein CISIN_1g005301mg [Citrus sinensis]KDO48149.1 hypothetical protein CISIN_1g005301mg [Citrus sinensis]
MGTTALRQLLKSFCYNLPWNYAVLWKLKLEGQMILSWEDGYCDHLKPREPLGIMSEDIYHNGANELFSTHSETSAGDGGFEGYSIGLVLANMSHLQYALGEGVVGEVANSGTHFWVSYDDVSTTKVNSKLVPKCPDEWLLQLASGIKTILLVPVLPHGVVQLGSLQVIAEDVAVVAGIKDRFIHNAWRNTVLSILNRDIRTKSSSTLTSGLMDSLDEPSASTISQLKSEDSDAVDSVKPNKVLLSTFDPILPVETLQDALRGSVKDLSGTFRSESENKIAVPSLGLSEASKSQGHSLFAGQWEMMEREFSGGAMSCYPASMEQPFQHEICNNIDHSSAIFLNFPKDCELHKALGPAFQRHTSDYLGDSYHLVDNICNSSSLIRKRDLTDGIEPTSSVKGSDADLLEAVVTSVRRGTYGSSDLYSGVNSSLISLEKFVTLSLPQSHSEDSASAGVDSIPQSKVISTSLSGNKNEFTPTSSSFKNEMGTFIDTEQFGKEHNSLQPRKGMKLSNANKRRTKPGDNQKPRPRDRQLIQDRIKELRELVPNGVKCSIDCLLGRTIEHMLYLRSVTDQAEKLNQWVHREVAARKDLRSSETNDGKQNGTTWAFEVGNELLACPIVVEDLSYPGHMLIEMLCNEQSLFLEIAQVIRSLELTILKGVMENRCNNTWAHFIVETSKGFHRTEIFWPLMHLLQRKRKPISSKI